jgi:hypothetical protein
MAMKKDDDKNKKTASTKKPVTMSGKQPYKTGGANPLGVRKLNASKPTALTPSGPRAEPSRPMGRDATGERNFDKTPRSRATISAGPATMSLGGRTAKSTGGMNMTGGKVLPKKSSPMAKMSGSSTAPSTVKGSQNVLAKQEIAAKRSRNLALGIGGTVVGAGITLAGGGKKIKQAVKYIADTKNRKERNRVQKAENDAMIIERKAKAEAKNPSTPVAKVKASKSTMKNIKRLKKGQ